MGVEESSPPGRQGQGGSRSRPGRSAPGSQRRSGSKSKRRRRLSAEIIIDAAIRIADADGLDAVSIRRVAAELDARPMSLYGHIAGKDQLFGAMAEKTIEEMLVSQPLPESWREAVTALARLQYAAFVAHPWLVRVFTQTSSFGPNGTRLAKQNARAWAGLRLEPPDVWLLQGTVNDYLLGHSLRAGSVATGSELADAISPGDVVEFPELASLQDSLRSRASVERFESGLKIVLDGIERRFLDRGRHSAK